MHSGFSHNPALVVSLALAAGVVAQTLARHLKIPGIVLLLAAGVTLGPDGIGLIRPAELGPALDILIGFSVAVILFDGGLNLDLRRMRRQGKVIRRLLSTGVIVTVVGAAAAARLAMGWGWTPALLFGTLVIVTGPTVVTPLLRRIKVRRSVETILESEGVLIDAVGAVIAVVALEIALGEAHMAAGALSAPLRLVTGLAVGLAGGGLMGLLLRWRTVVPDGYATIFTLSFTLAAYQLSNALVPESGIMAAITAGAIVANANPESEREIREFKEQLTVLLIGMLFVLLAADVRLAEVAALGWPGVLVVLALVLVVRPLNIVVCTVGSGLDWHERAFLAWVAPRGIVAAAVASLFATRLDAVGHGYGQQLRALVFLVIAATVVLQGMTAGWVARLLGVRRPGSKGVALLGAGPGPRLMARLLEDHGQDVVLIDASPGVCQEAEAEGLRVIFGNGLDEGVILRAQMDTRRVAVGATLNEGVNLLFARKMREDAKVPRVLALGEAGHAGVTREHFAAAGVGILFGGEIDAEMWSARLRRGKTATALWERVDDAAGSNPDLPPEARHLLLPLFFLVGGGKLDFIDERSSFGKGKKVLWLLDQGQAEEAATWLQEQGWRPCAPPMVG